MSPKALAPETLANGPDTLSWIFTILRALSATLLSQLTAVSSRHRRNWSASLRKRVARFQAFRWDWVNAGVVSGSDGPGTAGVDTAPSGTGGGFGGGLGVHEDARHLGGPGRERLGLANGLEVP
jgi:hypothetical protein